MPDVLRHVISSLVQDGQLELVPDASTDRLVQEILAEIGGAGAFAQAGATIGRALVASPLVVELYADDKDIVDILNHMYG